MTRATLDRTAAGDSDARPRSARTRLGSSVGLLTSDFRSPLYRNGYALVLGALLTSVLGLVYWLVAARRYPAATLGVQSAVISAMLLISGLAQLSLNTVLVRYVPIAGRATRRLVVVSYTAAATAGFAAAALFAAGTRLWSPALHVLWTDGNWFALFVVATGLWSIFALQDSVLIGMRRAIWVPVENTLVSLVKVALLVMVASRLVHSGIFVAWVVPSVVAVVVVNAFVLGRASRSHAAAAGGIHRLPSRGAVARYAAGNYMGSVFFLATTALLPLLVINRAGAVANAHFTAPWGIAIALQLVPASLGLSLTVEAVLDREKFYVYARAVLRRSLLLVTPVVVLVFVAGPYALQVFGHGYATDGGPLLRWLALATLPNVLVAVALSVARALDRPWVVASIQAGTCAVLLTLSYALLPSLGIEAVGIASFASQTAVALFVLVPVRSLRRRTPVPAPGST